MCHANRAKLDPGKYVMKRFGFRGLMGQSEGTRGRSPGWRRSFTWLGLVIVTGALVLGLRSPAVAATPRHYTDLTFPPLPEVRLPDATEFQLANGMTVYLIEDRELPLISGRALIRTGSRWEPPEQAGLASITGAVLRSGGTTAHAADTLNQLLEDRAASIESSIGTSSGSVTFNALSENTDEVLGWFAEVLRSPAFEASKIDLEKQQWRGAIARRNDDPNDIAYREFDKLIYGADSPYASTVEYATLDRIEREDVVDFYARYIVPSRIILGIVGDFDTATLRQQIETVFGDWQVNAPPLPALPAVEPAQTPGVFYVDRPQLTQSTVVLGHLGGLASSPDYPALSVTNNILNGFGGRLFNELRSRQGLAYSVYGYWGTGYDYPGTMIAGGQTRSEATVPLIAGIRQEIERLQAEPITEDELAYARESTLNSFVFNFADPGQTLSRLMTYDYFDYPSDFLFRYQNAVKATTIADVQRVAQTYFQPDRLTMLVVGNLSAIQPPLSELDATPTAIDITIATPTAAAQN